jgi:DNA-binding CsgD family transcriptional regulator
VVVEDVHELDPALIRALGEALDLLDSAPILVVATVRVGDDPPGGATGRAIADLCRHARVIGLTVGPLSGEGVATMADAPGRDLDAKRHRRRAATFGWQRLLRRGVAAGQPRVAVVDGDAHGARPGANGRSRWSAGSRGTGHWGRVARTECRRSLEPEGAEGLVSLLAAGIALEVDREYVPGRPDRRIVRARAASELGDVAMISAVRGDLEDLIDRGGSGLIRAGAEWAGGLWAHHRGQRRETCRRLRTAAELCEQSSRYVLAVEAWCDLAAVAVGGEDRDLRAMALERARQLADGRELVALKARIGELVRDESVDARSWPAAFDALAPRQRDIAVLVAEGMTNRQIGERLFLSEHTVRNQLVQIFDKLGVARRSELVARAARSAIAPNGR